MALATLRVTIGKSRMQLQHIKMTRAVNSKKEVVSINEVANGKSCSCYCIVCNSPLIARQGNERSWSFAHDSSYDIECKWSGETELHLRLKEYLLKQSFIEVPVGINFPRLEKIKIDETNEELRIESINRIPDITVNSNGELIHIEVAVSHFCDKEKIINYKESNINAIEFDFSSFKAAGDVITDEDISSYFSANTSSAKWLSVAPAGNIGQMIHDHERSLLHQLNEKHKQDITQRESKLRDLDYQILQKQQFLSVATQQFNDSDYKTRTLSDLDVEFKSQKASLQRQLEHIRREGIRRAEFDAKNTFNSEINTHLKALKDEFLTNNLTLIEEYKQQIEITKQELDSNTQLLLENKLELNTLKAESENIEKALALIEPKIRAVAQARKQLTRILPEFKMYFRKTGTPNPFDFDLENKLNVDIIDELYLKIMTNLSLKP